MQRLIFPSKRLCSRLCPNWVGPFDHFIKRIGKLVGKSPIVHLITHDKFVRFLFVFPGLENGSTKRSEAYRNNNSAPIRSPSHYIAVIDALFRLRTETFTQNTQAWVGFMLTCNDNGKINNYHHLLYKTDIFCKLSLCKIYASPIIFLVLCEEHQDLSVYRL
jgi:hypothetical protein